MSAYPATSRKRKSPDADAGGADPSDAQPAPTRIFLTGPAEDKEEAEAWADEGWAEQQRLPRRVVLKMLPEWALSEQLNSAMQLQHSKEAWAIENWAGMGCRVPRGLYTATRGASGEFIHIMEHMTDWSTGTPALLPVNPVCIVLTV